MTTASKENGRARPARVKQKIVLTYQKPDMVNHPPHYNVGGIECIDAIKAACTGLSGIEGYCTGNAIKYLWRWKHKNKVQDLQKAVWYINRLIKEIEDGKL